MISSQTKEGLSIGTRRQLLYWFTWLAAFVIVGFSLLLAWERANVIVVAILVIFPGLTLFVFAYFQHRKLNFAQSFKAEEEARERIVRRLKKARERARLLNASVQVITLRHPIDHHRVEFTDFFGNPKTWTVPYSHSLNKRRLHTGDQLHLTFEDLSDETLARIAYQHPERWFDDLNLETYFFTLERVVEAQPVST